MGFFPNEGDVDSNGAEEVNLRTSAGAELLGQQVSAASLPVVVASNQPPVPIIFRGPSTQHVRINTNTTTVVKSGSGILRRIIKMSGGNLTLYNNTAGSGTVIQVISGTNPTGTLIYDIEFTIGLTIVSASGPDAIIVYE